MATKQVNIEFITKQLGSLYEEALDSILEKIENKGFKVSNDDNRGEGTNRLEVIISVSNEHQEHIDNFNDVFRKHQLLGSKGGDVPYSNNPVLESPLKEQDKNEDQAPKPILTDKTELTKNEILIVINYLVMLSGYQGLMIKTYDNTLQNVINDLVNKVNQK